MKRVGTVATAAAVMLLAGCVQPAPQPSLSPTPTFMCTPEAGGAEAPCSELQYKEMQKREALYVEAEKVYRAYQAEKLKVIRMGGAHELNTQLKSFIGNEDTAEVIRRELSGFKAQGLSIKGPGVRVTKVTRIPGVTKNGSVVSLRFCVDSTSTSIYRKGKKFEMGILGQETVHFAQVDSEPRMVYIEGKRVQACDD